MVTQHQDDDAAGRPGGHVFDADSIFGVHIVRAADPADHAAHVAAEVNGEVVHDFAHAQRAFAARAEAGRAEPVVLRDEEWVDLEAAANADDAPDNVSEATIGELQELADELAMAERIRVNTEAEVTDWLSRRLSAASAVAVHPEAIRQAATAVTGAEDAVAACDADLEALGPLPSAPGPASWDGIEMTSDDEPAPMAAEEAESHRPVATPQPTEATRRGGALAIIVGLVFAAGAVVLLALGLLAVAVVVFVVGLVLAAVLLRRSRKRARVDPTETREASAHLAGTTAWDLPEPEPKAPEMRPAAAPALSDDEWRARRDQIEQTKERASERLRSARKHWESLVGLDADPHDVDGVLRVRDPQLELVGVASKSSPTVRTVSAVHRRTLARWRVAWASVGYDDPPALDDVGAQLDRLRASGGTGADAARERLASAQAWRDACAAIDRPIVLVEPEEWLPEDQLEAMLGTLPAGAEVIIVEADGPEGGADS
jgi:membrane protein implicated in regulation of membrane protease activity